MSDTLKPGLTATVRITVDTARTIGFMGEDLRVYSTPSLLYDVEVACRELVEGLDGFAQRACDESCDPESEGAAEHDGDDDEGIAPVAQHERYCCTENQYQHQRTAELTQQQLCGPRLQAFYT